MTKAERQRRTLEATAYHEAGHAVVALDLRRAVRYLTIVPEGGSLGHVANAKPPASFQPDLNSDRKTGAWIEREVMIGLAGLVAEGIFRGRHNHIGASSDLHKVSLLASYHYGDGEVLTKWVDYMLASTKARVGAPRIWIQVEAIAAELMLHGRLGAKRIREVCKQALSNRDRYEELVRISMAKSEEKRKKAFEKMGIADD